MQQSRSNLAASPFSPHPPQHRLTTITELLHEPGQRPDVHFQISVKVVRNKEAANDALFAMQRCYMPDPRCFFSRDREGFVAAGQ